MEGAYFKDRRMNIGARMKELRKESGMTLLELSEKSGVALATLSRIENNKMTGTLESHVAICKALDISLPELYERLSPPRKNPEVQTHAERTEIFVPDKKAIVQMLVPKISEKKMMPIIIRLEPKGATHKEENKRGTEKFIYVLDGKVEAAVDNKNYILTKGNTLYFESSAPHRFKNIGSAEARLLCVSNPPVL